MQVHRYNNKTRCYKLVHFWVMLVTLQAYHVLNVWITNTSKVCSNWFRGLIDFLAGSGWLQVAVYLFVTDTIESLILKIPVVTFPLDGLTHQQMPSSHCNSS